MSWIEFEPNKFENGNSWILELDAGHGWILYHEEIEDEFPNSFLPLNDLFGNPGTSVITVDPDTGKIPVSLIPSLAISDVFVVSSESSMLSLNAQRGDIAIRTDLPGPAFFILALDDSTALVNWIQITSSFIDWASIQNLPDEFPPSEHDHNGSYYTKPEIDLALSDKRDVGNIPALEVIEDEDHRFVSDLEIALWNSFENHDHNESYYTKLEIDDIVFELESQLPDSPGGGLTNPLDQDINFAVGNGVQYNGKYAAGFLEDGTPYFKETFLRYATNGFSGESFAHGIPGNIASNFKLLRASVSYLTEAGVMFAFDITNNYPARIIQAGVNNLNVFYFTANPIDEPFYFRIEVEYI
ncbi:hypothetical protein DLM76_17220 [Leptospira yasudae]|uniref:hypothetical protein n=1 Tax=Leptospira yasudae TaxID=2202201 RepID=UPI000E59AA30|nr:hypothetical protein [Leptospira yasudae]RHX91468.1 hypothetical protein DLM76_17220 [Leptospira yasudae]